MVADAAHAGVVSVTGLRGAAVPSATTPAAASADASAASVGRLTGAGGAAAPSLASNFGLAMPSLQKGKEKYYPQVQVSAG